MLPCQMTDTSVHTWSIIKLTISFSTWDYSDYLNAVVPKAVNSLVCA